MLSERDRRIIAVLEREIHHDDPNWVRRFTRTSGRFERRVPTPEERLRCRIAAIALTTAWAVLMCVAGVHENRLWLYVLLGLGGLVLLGFLVRGYLRRLAAYRRLRRVTGTARPCGPTHQEGQ